MKTWNLIIILYTLFLIGCDGLTDTNVTGPYYLVAVDGNDNMTLSYSVSKDNSAFVGIIEPCVYAVGYNRSYIIVKQHPVSDHTIEKLITYYYIVPVYKRSESFPEKGVYGPYTLEQFNNKRKELNLPDNLSFTKVIKELQ